MIRAIEHPGERCEVQGEFDELRGRCALERVVLECNCRARLILDDRASIQHIEGLGVPDCGVCKERFTLTLE